MAVGPVQLIVLGFAHPQFEGEILDELQRLREADTIRVIDALAVYKDAQGEVAILEMSNLTKDEEIELGAKIGALVGIGAFGDDEANVEKVALAGAETAAEEGVGIFSAEEAWDVVGDIPNDTAAILLMIEHHWAVGLRDAVARANGFRVADGFVSPLPRGLMYFWRSVAYASAWRTRMSLSGGTAVFSITKLWSGSPSTESRSLTWL
jgi:uncharacterized membrane protein